ncbi:MAG: hypothetical protein HY665_05670 [Chloroflexi bacterium]|nr:hypothetical protein [Chloroflexota bacterium]
MKRYPVSTVLAILVLTSGSLVSCAQDAPLTPTPPAPVELTRSAALRNYFSKAAPIVEDHTSTMDTVHDAVEAIKAIYSQPQQAIGFQRITAEGIAAQLKAKGIVDGGVNKIEDALQKVGSEIVDFGILSPPAEAMNYHRLITNYFLKDRAALSDWLYYYTTLRERRYRDNETRERADRHYREARELQLQAEHEWKAIQQKVRQ